MQSSIALRGTGLRPHRQAQRQAPAPRRGGVATRAGLLDFFKPPQPAAKQPSRAQELVEELLAASIPTQAGDKASDAQREQIAALVDELEQYCPKAPLKSPLLWGDYEVVYAARPGTIAGPFKSPVGRVVFPGLDSSQELIAPNLVVNKANFKTLGFIPGSVKQEGYFEPLDGNTFKLIFPQQDGKRPGGPRERLITIAYLDERIRVARFTPSEDDPKSQPTFYVFTRKQQAGQEEEEEEEAQPAPAKARARAAQGSQRRGRRVVEEEEEEEAAPAPAGPLRGLGTLRLGKKEGLATQVEKSYYRKKEGTGPSGTRGTGTTGTRGTGTTRRGATEAGTGRRGRAAALEPAKTRAQEAAERAAAREAAAAERAAARERAEAERRAAAERQAAEREAARERAAAIKAQLAELGREAQEAQEAARVAAAELKSTEKDAAPLLRQASQARALMESAVAAAVAASQQLAGLKEAEKAAGREVEAAKKVVRQLEALSRGK